MPKKIEISDSEEHSEYSESSEIEIPKQTKKQIKQNDIPDSNASRRQLRKGMLRSGELASLDDDLCKTSAFAEPQILDNQFKEFSVEKRKRGRPFGSLKKCISSER